MVTVVKSEWHQVEKRYSYEVDESLLQEIYPDLNDEEIAQKLTDIMNGNLDFEVVMEDAEAENVYLDWEWMDQDDWWTDRKGGYEVTYSVEE